MRGVRTDIEGGRNQGSRRTGEDGRSHPMASPPRDFVGKQVRKGAMDPPYQLDDLLQQPEAPQGHIYEVIAVRPVP
jgi:hypothetical protein